MKRFHIVVSGLVQGVSFRFNTLHQAQALDLTGWVRNLPDRRVEIIAEGEIEKLNQLLEWCQHGPRFAKVTRVDVEQTTASNLFTNFRIR